MAANQKYQEAAQKEGIKGRVIIQFIVRKDGSLTDITVIRSLRPDLDNEAIRVIKSMPRWKPGRHKGEPADVYYNMPFTF